MPRGGRQHRLHEGRRRVSADLHALAAAEHQLDHRHARDRRHVDGDERQRAGCGGLAAMNSKPQQILKRKSAKASRHRQHASRVRSPDHAAAVSFGSSIVPLNFDGSSSMPKLAE